MKAVDGPDTVGTVDRTGVGQYGGNETFELTRPRNGRNVRSERRVGYAN